MKILMDFFIVGAQRAASTTLYELLRRHSAIFLPESKENRFFVSGEFHRQGDAWLQPFYARALPGQLLGGAYANTLMFPDAIRRMHRHNPAMKLIAILRNPIDRAYSAYWFARRNGLEQSLTFEAALRKEPQRAAGTQQQRAELTYLEHGHYASQLRPVVDLFGRDKLFVVLTEDLQRSDSPVLEQLISFLDLPAGLAAVAPPRLNASARPRLRHLQRLLFNHDLWWKRKLRRLVAPRVRYWIRVVLKRRIRAANLSTFTYPPLAPGTRQRLREHYLGPNLELETLLNRDLRIWR